MKSLNNLAGSSFGKLETRATVIQCERHGEVKATKVFLSGEELPVECPLCAKEKAEAEKRLAMNNPTAKREAYKAGNIEKEFWNKTLDDFKPLTPTQVHAQEAVRELITKKTGKVVLLGPNGVGKTHLGTMAVKALRGKILSMYEISTSIRQSYKPDSKESELEIVKELASIPMLVIDEIGRTKGSESEMNWLSYILDKRHTRNLPFMLLSNKHLVENCTKKGCSNCFERYFDNDVLSRLSSKSEIITIGGPDYRQKGDT